MSSTMLQVREQEGVDVADGVDTLLVYLLAETEDAPGLAGFAEGPQQAAPALVAGLLQRKGQSDALAQLYAGAGQPAAGLALWKVRFTLLDSSIKFRFQRNSSMELCFQ